MYQFLANKAYCAVFVAILLTTYSVSGVTASTLSLDEAERLALKNDYTLKAIQSRGQSMSELLVATEKLPDPQLKLGFANLPTDSFSLGQEPMTQAIIGIRQQFPRGNTRALKSNRVQESAARTGAEAADREQVITLEVRQEFIRVYLHQERQKILQQSLVVFANLAEITRDYYASGRAHQHDVVQTQLELSKVAERLNRIRQQEEEARARLAEQIGDSAYLELAPQWPEVSEPLSTDKILAQLGDHPRLQAWKHEVSKFKTSEDIARQAYKPGFALDLAYGGRSGQDIDGSNRSDFLSVFVTMDIPLFTKNRQDRVLASSIADTTATEFARDDIYRSMKARVTQEAASLAHERERLEFYEDSLLPQASFNAEASFEAYQNAVVDLTTLMRARIGEYELKLDHANLRAEAIISRAQLLYLQGESS